MNVPEREKSRKKIIKGVMRQSENVKCMSLPEMPQWEHNELIFLIDLMVKFQDIQNKMNVLKTSRKRST